MRVGVGMGRIVLPDAGMVNSSTAVRLRMSTSSRFPIFMAPVS